MSGLQPRNLLSAFDAVTDESTTEATSQREEEKFEIPIKWLNPEFPMDIIAGHVLQQSMADVANDTSTPAMSDDSVLPPPPLLVRSNGYIGKCPMEIDEDGIISTPGWEGWHISSFIGRTG